MLVDEAEGGDGGDDKAGATEESKGGEVGRRGRLIRALWDAGFPPESGSVS